MVKAFGGRGSAPDATEGLTVLFFTTYSKYSVDSSSPVTLGLQSIMFAGYLVTIADQTMTECCSIILKLDWKTSGFFFIRKSGNPV